MLAPAAALVLSGCSSGKSHEPAAVHPGTLVLEQRIGNISLGESRARVEQEYGSTEHGFHLGQRYSGAQQGWYKGLHGSKVWLTFYGRRVGELSINAPFYRTKNGFGVGSRIPLGPCHRHRIARGRCDHVWHGFVYNAWGHESPCSCWTKVGLGPRSLAATVANFNKPWFIIYVRHGRVHAFDFDLQYVD